MTPPLDDPTELRAGATAPASTSADDHEQNWGYECALPYLQGLAAGAESAVDGGWRGVQA